MEGIHSVEIVKMLLSEENIQPNILDKDGRSALIIAASDYKDDPEVLKMLVETGEVDIDRVDNHGYTAFMNAATCNRINNVKYLLSTGKVLIDRKNNDGENALIQAMYNGMHQETVAFLMKTGKFDTNDETEKGVTPLMYLTEYGSLEDVEMMLDRDDVIVYPDFTGDNALQTAADKNDIDKVKTILAKDASGVDYSDEHNITPLILAVRNGNVEMVTLLLNYDVDPNAYTFGSRHVINERTPLLDAIEIGSEEIVALLLATGKVDINHQDEQGHSALIEAVDNNEPKIVEILLRVEGIDTELVDDDDNTALDIATRYKYNEIIKLLGKLF